jgi:hypothetical protein
MMRNAVAQIGSYHRVPRLVRTIADLDDSIVVAAAQHPSEAL